LKVLTVSTVLLHSSLIWMHFVQFVIFSNFKSFMTSSHLFFGLPAVRAANGVHLQISFY
jgi:hypothetical protein